jgi:hypothetical protein
MPARLALLSPIAIACCGERTPCFPSRTCSISSRTNSPAAVDGDLPSRRSSSARFFVDSSGIAFPSDADSIQPPAYLARSTLFRCEVAVKTMTADPKRRSSEASPRQRSEREGALLRLPSRPAAAPLALPQDRTGKVPATPATPPPPVSRSPPLRLRLNKSGSDRRQPPSSAAPAPQRP